MTIRTCLARTIPALWFSLLVWAALPAPADPPARPASITAPSGLASLVRSYREHPTPTRLATVETWAATHPKEAPLPRLGLGIAAYEQRDFATAEATLKKVQGKLPAIADYIAYYLAASRVESRDYHGVAGELVLTHGAGPVSPLAGRAWLLEARAAKENASAEAARLLRAHYTELPQPEGDLTLADCYQAAADLR